MRRLCILLSFLAFIGNTVGCNHTGHMAGVCDCEAGPGPQWVPPPPRSATIPPPESIKTMPKPNL